MKIIDLLNKIANGEEVPKKIKYKTWTFIYVDEFYGYMKENYLAAARDEIISFNAYIVSMEELNDEVKIIEEEKEDNFTGWKMYQDGKEVCSMDCSVEEDKEIEKLIEPITLGDIHENLISINKIASKVNELIDKVNSLENKQ